VFNSWADERIARNLEGEPAMSLIPDDADTMQTEAPLRPLSIVRASVRVDQRVLLTGFIV